jgi:hypothetical protein
MAEYKDLLKDTSTAIEDGNYFNVTITDLQPNTSYPIQIRWKYKDGTYSDWSSVKRLSPVTAADSPSVDPSVPTVTSVLGAINLTWNGKTSTGGDQPYGFDSAKVYIGTTSNFTPTDSGANANKIDILDFANGQNAVYLGVGTVVNSSLTLDYDTDYYVKIKTTNGNAAQDSAEVEAVGNPIRIGKVSSDGIVEVTADKITTGTLQSSSTITVGSTSGKHVIIRGTGNPLSIYGSGGTASGTILDFDSSGNLSIKGTINATAGAFTGAVSIDGDGGSMKIGKEVDPESTYDGLYMGTNNYWYNDGLFEVGNGTTGIKWDATNNLVVTGKIIAASGRLGTLADGWEIASSSLKTYSENSAIQFGDTGSIYYIQRSNGQFTIKENSSFILNTAGASGTDGARIYLGNSTRQVEVVKSAQISGVGTLLSDPNDTSAAGQAYRSGGLRNIYTVSSSNYNAGLYPSAVGGDMLVVF